MLVLPQLNERNFADKVLRFHDCPVVVLFSKPGCTACVSARFAVKKFAEKYEGKVDVYTVDILMNPQLGITYGKQGVPLVAVFVDGLEVWRRVGGAVKPHMISAQVDAVMPGEAA